jgi:flagellar protein FlgJ
MDINFSQNIPSATDDAAEKARLLSSRKISADGVIDEKQRQKLKKISQDFEGLFVGMMLKSMRETVGKEKLTDGGRGEEIFKSMLDQEYVAAASKTGGFGLAKQIEKELIRQETKRVPHKIDKVE